MFKMKKMYECDIYNANIDIYMRSTLQKVGTNMQGKRNSEDVISWNLLCLMVLRGYM